MREIVAGWMEDQVARRESKGGAWQDSRDGQEPGHVEPCGLG